MFRMKFDKDWSFLYGKSSVKVTEESYLDLTTENLRTKYQRYSPLMNLKRVGGKR